MHRAILGIDKELTMPVDPLKDVSLRLASVEHFVSGASFDAGPVRANIPASSPSLRYSGTTVLAMIYNKGVLIAGDKRVTFGHFHEDNATKVRDTGNLTLVAFSGFSFVINELIEKLKFVSELLEQEIEIPIFVDGQVGILSRILKNNFWALGRFGFYATPIMAGYDIAEKRGRIFEFDFTGDVSEKGYFVVSGSGGGIAKTVLDCFWEIDLDEESATMLAVSAIHRASCDIHTAPAILAPPDVYTISEEFGVKKIEEKVISRLSLELCAKDLKRFGSKNLMIENLLLKEVK